MCSAPVSTWKYSDLKTLSFSTRLHKNFSCVEVDEDNKSNNEDSDGDSQDNSLSCQDLSDDDNNTGEDDNKD